MLIPKSHQSDWKLFLKINLDIDAKPDEIVDLLRGLSAVSGTSENRTKDRSFAERMKPKSPSERNIMRSICMAQMQRGEVPKPPVPGIEWGDVFDAHELDEDDPIAELFIDKRKIVNGSNRSATKRLATKKS